MQRSDIALFDKGHKIGAQTRRQGHGEKAVPVFGVSAQPRLCHILSTSYLLLEARTLLRIGFVFFPRAKGGVVLIKLTLQHSEPVEFRKQNAGSLAGRPHGIAGMKFLPRLEIFLRAGKI